MNKNHLLKFLDFTIDLETLVLSENGQPISVEPQVFDLIRFLAENTGKLVTRDEINEAIWSGRIVSDASISTRISAARTALGDSGKTQAIIKTIPRRGFRFLPEVETSGPKPQPGTANIHPNGVLPQLPKKPSISIAPIETFDPDPETQNLAHGVRIDIQNALVRVSGLFLTATGSANSVAGQPHESAAEILGVEYLLVGQVRRAARTVRFSMQLVNAASGAFIWSNQYEFQPEDSFSIPDDITAKVLTALNVHLVAGEHARVWHKNLPDIASLRIFYRGISKFFEMSREGLSLARRDFEKLADQVPDSPIGATWTSLSHWYDFQNGWSANPDTSQKLAREWALKATQFDDNDGQACTVLSHVHLLDREFDAALGAGAAAVKNRPSCAFANGFYANVLHYCGNQGTALKYIDLAIRHAPITPAIFLIIKARILRAMGELDAANHHLTDVLAKNPDDIAALVLRAKLAVERDDQQATDQAVGRIQQAEPTFSAQDYLDRLPHRDADILKQTERSLRKAGLLEG